MRRWRSAAAMSARLPASSDPPGAPRPLEKATATRSKGAASSASLRPLATAAFHSRAPSRKLAMPRFPRAPADAHHLVLREDDTAAAVVGVLDLHQRRRRKHRQAARLDRGFELVRGEQPAPSDLDQLHAGVGRGAAGLVPAGVRLAAGDDLVARPRQHAQRHLVGHRARRQPERRLLAQQLRAALLQQVRRRVLAVLAVAHRGGGHRRAHGVGGAGDGVGTQVDGVGHGLASLCAGPPLSVRRQGATPQSAAGRCSAGRPARQRRHMRCSRAAKSAL